MVSQGTSLAPSRLENLPGELFNRILGFVLDPSSSETAETDTHYRGYRFELAILRVNRAIHQLAKSYLHHKLSWIRVDINRPVFAMEPHRLGIPYIIIGHSGVPKQSVTKIKNHTPVEVSWRPFNQDIPNGQIHVTVEFPHAARTLPRRIHLPISYPYPAEDISVLILQEHFRDFVRAMRMHDLADCPRIQPQEPDFPHYQTLTTANGRPGMTYTIRTISEHIPSAKYSGLIENFRNIHGTLHRCVMMGTKDTTQRSIIGTIEQPSGTLQPRPVLWELVSQMFWLKARGDEQLLAGNYENAYMAYIYVEYLETCGCQWSDDDEVSQHEWWAGRSFDDDTNNLSFAFNTSLAVNMATACIYAGVYTNGRLYKYQPLTLLLLLWRHLGETTRTYNFSLSALVNLANLNKTNTITVGWHVAHQIASVETLRSLLGTISLETNVLDEPPLITAIRQLTSQHLELFQGASATTNLSKLRSTFLIDYRRTLIRHPAIGPFKWAILEHHIPPELLGMIDFLPRIQDPCVNERDRVAIPQFSPTTDEAHLKRVLV